MANNEPFTPASYWADVAAGLAHRRTIVVMYADSYQQDLEFVRIGDAADEIGGEQEFG